MSLWCGSARGTADAEAGFTWSSSMGAAPFARPEGAAPVDDPRTSRSTEGTTALAARTHLGKRSAAEGGTSLHVVTAPRAARRNTGGPGRPLSLALPRCAGARGRFHRDPDRDPDPDP